MTNEQRMIVSSLRAQGMGYGAIARKVGISENTVKSFCRRNAQKEDKPQVAGAGEHRCLCCGALWRRVPAGRKRSSAVISAGINGGTPIWTRLTAGRYGRLPVLAAVRFFQSMDRRRENTAAMIATSDTGSEAARMSKEQMRREKLYQATMSIVRKMLAEGLITEEEYRQIDTMFLEKYRPLFGALCSEIR